MSQHSLQASPSLPAEWGSGLRTLFFGIGNVGRQDDGLGIRLIEKLESLSLPDHIGLEANYQLNAEDAHTISDYEVVVFVDATTKPQAKSPFEVCTLKASQEVSFSTHAMSMGSILAFCDQVYGKKPKAFLLTMPGRAWEMTEGLSEVMSPQAQENLAATFNALTAILEPHHA